MKQLNRIRLLLPRKDMGFFCFNIEDSGLEDLEHFPHITTVTWVIIRRRLEYSFKKI